MKNKIISLFLGLLLVTAFAGAVWSGEGKGIHTIMRPDRETLQRWIKDYERAPRAKIIDRDFSLSRSFGGSRSLLSHLKYTPSEHNQGSCGNCWAWAGTGAMAIALDVEEGIFDRLSVQFASSCNRVKSCCDGGWLSDLADFYGPKGYTIPWSNTNASWQNGDGRCNVPCSSIAISPSYSISSIEAQAVETHSVSQAGAIANLKNVLNQGKAVWFGFFMATKSDWESFYDFWDNSKEEVTWNFDYSLGHTWDEANGGGHAVLCVGYNDDDPDNSYWIILNSWGTTPGRPNGLFRLDMDMEYDGWFYDRGYYYSYYWQTLDIEYSASSSGSAVVTLPATSVTSSSAQLNGTVNPNGQSTTYRFEYGTTTAYGSATGTMWAGSGTTAVSVRASISWLKAGTVYHYRIAATNSAGTVYGSDQTFTTTSASAMAPIVTTTAATAVTANAAQLNGTVNPNGTSTTYYFQYGTTTSYGYVTGTKSAGAGTTALPASAAITGLTPGTIYHYRVVAKNSAGTSYGSDQTLTTTSVSPLAPAVVTMPATSVTSSSAQLNGTVNPNGTTTTYYFEYGTTTGYGAKSGNQEAGSGTAAVSVSAAVTGLAPGTLYHYRLVATNSAGTGYGSDRTFTTTSASALAPTAITMPATSVTSSSAQLNGSVNPNGTVTTYFFEYGTTTGYGANSGTQGAGSGTTAVSVSAALTGLTPGTTYHYRIAATSSAGTGYGSDRTFTTSKKVKDMPWLKLLLRNNGGLR